MKKIGFTGTRKELTAPQKIATRMFLVDLAFDGSFEPVEFHHGDCVGADEYAAVEAYKLKWRIVTHPPVRNLLRANFANSDEEREPKHFLERNHNIVDETDRLIACPEGPETMRSGTWATIRYAKKMGKPVIVIWPSGTVEYLPEQGD